ncbi:hypothetical protein E4Z66_06530 [Aliishimia ponticola]|uniref:Uncharacterized protein n=1 Tax=Aliishimia ponticola TaxID=2499833 RepID=A0A4S4NER0_9RHOB|nr:hypothetical protein [Aliishimia ponticola]THH36601.1 hypothetical protein E4Z66_06530 [Aliishimia ponticola]
MAYTLHRKLITGVAALALAITALAPQGAQAGDRDTERALAALLGLAVVGAIIADNRRDKPDVSTRGHGHRVVKPYVHPKKRPHVHRHSGAHVHRHNGPHVHRDTIHRPQAHSHRVEPRPLPRRVKRHN